MGCHAATSGEIQFAYVPDSDEPRQEKIRFLPMRKQMHRSSVL